MHERGEHAESLRGQERTVWMDGCLRLAAQLFRRGVPVSADVYRACWDQTIRRIIARRNGEEAARQWDALSDAAKRERMARTLLSLERFRTTVIENAFPPSPPTGGSQSASADPWRWN